MKIKKKTHTNGPNDLIRVIRACFPRHGISVPSMYLNSIDTTYKNELHD